MICMELLFAPPGEPGDMAGLVAVRACSHATCLSCFVLCVARRCRKCPLCRAGGTRIQVARVLPDGIWQTLSPNCLTVASCGPTVRYAAGTTCIDLTICDEAGAVAAAAPEWVLAAAGAGGGAAAAPTPQAVVIDLSAGD